MFKNSGRNKNTHRHRFTASANREVLDRDTHGIAIDHSPSASSIAVAADRECILMCLRPAERVLRLAFHHPRIGHWLKESGISFV